MNSTVRRAGAFALVGSLSLAAPELGRAVVVPFVAVAALAVFVVEEGPLFELFARPGDRQDRTLYGLAGFSLAAAGLGLLTSYVEMPVYVVVASVLVLSYGNLAEHAARTVSTEPVVATGAFVAGGFLGGVGGAAVVEALGETAVPPPELAFLGAAGAVLGALLRSVLFERDDPLVMLSVGLLLWLFAELSVTVDAVTVAVALAVPAAFGYLAYRIGTASITGMLAGVFLGLLTIVLGGYGWFVVLIAFFAVGGLATKFRYEEKQARGLAEANEGARGSGNVLANSAVALLAVLAFAASPLLPVPPDAFLFAFAGSLAAAMSDTLSSEIGGLYDSTRLITTFEPVPPGTDGGVTWQGELAGVAGAVLVAGIAWVLFARIGTTGAGVIVAAGVAGMTVDSLLGATLEGSLLDNRGVNFFATLAAALVGAGLAAGAGLLL